MNYPSQRALVITTSYGFARKLWHTRDAKTVVHKEKETPLLLSQKAAICTFGAAAAIYSWPYYVYVDASRLEISMRGVKPEDYGYGSKLSWIEYFFE